MSTSKFQRVPDLAALAQEQLFYQSGRDERLIDEIPVVMRLDGRAFHQLTKNYEKPFDANFREAMKETMVYLVDQFSPCIGYTQSDEITLVFQKKTVKSQIAFNARRFKLMSVVPSSASVFLYKRLSERFSDVPVVAMDAFANNVPSEIKAVYNLIWRENDAFVNAVNDLGIHHYGKQAVAGLKQKAIIQMLIRDKHWDSVPAHYRRGWYAQRQSVSHNRSAVQAFTLPPMATIKNACDVVFRADAPIV
jgi:tRNA(His) guanylyltransferase